MRIVLRVDAEPDGFLFDPRHPPPWRSFETALRVMEDARRDLERATGTWPTFAWGMRCDDQVTQAYGSPGWALEQYGEELDRLRAAGDDIGLHTHYYRILPDGKWVVEFRDTAWTRATLDEAHKEFRAARGHGPAFFAAGNKMVDQATVAHVGRLGIPYEVSVEPGLVVRAKSWFRADDCDMRLVPRHPYVADPGDFRRPGPSGTPGPVMVPAATGRPRLDDAPLPLSLALRARVWQQQRGNPLRPPWSTLYFGQRAWQFDALLADVLRRASGTGEGVLHVPTRNCLHPERTRRNIARLAALPGARFAGFTGIRPAAAA